MLRPMLRPYALNSGFTEDDPRPNALNSDFTEDDPRPNALNSDFTEDAPRPNELRVMTLIPPHMLNVPAMLSAIQKVLYCSMRFIDLARSLKAQILKVGRQ